MIDEEKLKDWKTWIEAFVINDVRKAKDENFLEVGPFILTVVGIDCLGGYLVGGKSTQDSFKKFIETYFPDKYHDHLQTLYNFRCKLLHQYIIPPNIIMAGDPNAEHLTKCVSKGKKRIWLNRSLFLQDFLIAWEKFRDDAFNDQDIYDNIMKRAKKYRFLKVISIDWD